MDSRLLLITCTTLLFRESQLPGGIDNSATVVSKILESVVLPEFSIGAVDSEREILAALKDNLLDMCTHTSSHQYETVEMLQKIRHAVGDDEALYQSFREGVESLLDENALKRFCLNLRQDLDKHVQEVRVQEIIAKDAYRLKFKRDTIPSLQTFVAEHLGELEPFQITGRKEDPAVVDSVNFTDKGDMTRVLKEARELNSDLGLIKLGWQGINRMTQGGLRRGEMVVVGALQHNFKSGFTTTIFKHAAIYNTPYMLDRTRKPLLLRISFEDALSITLPFLYKNLYENKTGRPALMKNLTDDEMTWYITDEMGVNGYEIMMMHVNPSLWTYRDIVNKVLTLEAEGYELHMLMLDYLPMVPTTGCNQSGPIGSDMRDMYRRIANFCRTKKITFVTPHQLSTEAKMLIRNEPEDTFVQRIQGKGYWDGCRTIDHEIDLELYIHIVRINGEAYLTCQRGKHRGFNLTPEAHKHCILKFEDIGDIRDDINGMDTTRKHIGGGPLGSKEEKPSWHFGGD